MAIFLAFLKPSGALGDAIKRAFHALAALCTLSGSIALAQVCASPGLDAATASISGVINSYYPGTSSGLAAGSKSIPLGSIDTSGGGAATPIAAGDLVIVMQMQGAEINFSNSDCYGDGQGTAGCATYTLTTAASYAGGNLSSNYLAGNWEYCTATSSASAALNVICGGNGGGTVNAYQTSAANSSVGAYRYQVIRVPQYGSVSLTGNVQSAAWNGATGGVLGMQATDALTLGGFNLDVSERGFRGGGVTFLGVYGPPLLDPVNGSFFYTAVAGTITGTTISGGEREGNFKGEGIAGTPRLLYNGTTQTGVISDDYPGGSRARGAPGNAGGGGNNQNGGGGGGGNGGRGGQGGGCWNDVSRPTTIGDCGGHGGDGANRAGNNLNLSSTRLIMGGGGGAGHVDGGGTNCQLGGWGGNGGGIIIARVGSLAGAGNVLANGRNGFTPNTAGSCTDAAGGAGAGGTILLASGASLGSRLLSATGGNGANSSYDRHGPGAGGGGGVVYFNAVGAPVIAVTGGNAGLDPGNLAGGAGAGDGVADTWFSTSGNGTSLGNSTALNTGCSTALAVTKTNGTDTLVSGNTTNYTITFSNAGPSSANNAVAKDTSSAGLLGCTATGCSGSGSPIAVCPAPALWPNLFTPAGLILTSLPANSSLTFNVSCGVSATGQ